MGIDHSNPYIHSSYIYCDIYTGAIASLIYKLVSLQPHSFIGYSRPFQLTCILRVSSAFYSYHPLTRKNKPYHLRSVVYSASYCCLCYARERTKITPILFLPSLLLHVTNACGRPGPNVALSVVKLRETSLGEAKLTNARD